MPDIVSAEKRSQMMSGIRGKNTKPELLVRKGLHSRGFRYRLHDTRLPGKPDLVFPKHHAVVFVHGCFWHKHNCHLFKWPSSRPDFWHTKINRNSEKDLESLAELNRQGWRVMVVWECALKGKTRLEPAFVIDGITHWLRVGTDNAEIMGVNIDGTK